MSRPIAVPGGWVQHRAAWTGGLEAFEKGVAEIQYDEKALTRTRVAVAALLVAEGDPSLRVVDEDIDEELAHAG